MTKTVVDLEHLEKNHGEVIHWVTWKSKDDPHPRHNRVSGLFTSLTGKRCVQIGGIAITVGQIIEISHHGRRW
jgi:hypothetical protein